MYTQFKGQLGTTKKRGKMNLVIDNSNSQLTLMNGALCIYTCTEIGWEAHPVLACDTHLQCRSWKLHSCLSRGHQRRPAGGRLAAGHPTTSHPPCSRNLENVLLLATPVNTMHIRLTLKRHDHLICDVVSMLQHICHWV